ncbi:MAG TPA: DUF3656 domain-containing protein, partial [Negativicutes bacterium]
QMVTLKLDEPLWVNDIVEFWVKVGGRVSSTVSLMKVKGESVQFAPAGAEVSIPVQGMVRMNDRVFKVFDAKLMERARLFFAGPSAVRRIPIDIKVEVAQGQPLQITIQDADGFSGQASTGFLAEKALKRPLTPEILAKQLERLGNTVFRINKLNCNISGEVMVPISEINDARRKAIEKLEEARLSRFTRAPLPDFPRWEKVFLPEDKNEKISVKIPALVVNVDTILKAHAALQQGADIIMFGGETFQHRVITADEYRQVVTMAHENGKKIILATPRLVKEWQVSQVKDELALFQELQPDAVSVSNLGTLHMAQQLIDIPIHGDYPLNIYNNIALQFFAEQELTSLTLSPELNFSQIEELTTRYKLDLECLVHGAVTLMVTEYCAMGSYLGELHAGSCKQACQQGEYWLKDRKNEIFPVVTDQFCRMHVLNAKILSMLPHVTKFGRIGVDRLRIEGKKSTSVEVGEITRLYRELLDQGDKHMLIVQDKVRTVEGEDITRGHYFRGVL